MIIPGGTNGAQLAVAARHVRPELKVLFGSGYTAAALSLEHGLPDNLNVVGKPYQRDELAKKTETGDRRIAVRWAKLLRTPERADPLPLARIRQLSETCGEVVLHVRGIAGR